MPRTLRPLCLPAIVGLASTSLTSAGAQPCPPPPQVAQSPASLSAAIRALGAVIGRPVEIPTSSGQGVSLWLLGEGDVVRAAWLTETEGHRGRPALVEIPRGVRVLGAVARVGVAYLLLESVASLDQPAGARGVVAITTQGEARLTDDEARSLTWVATPAELTRAVAVLASRAPSAPMGPVTAGRLEARMQRVLRGTSNSPTSFAASLSPSGLRYSVLHQGFLRSNIALIPRESFAAAPQASSVIAAARSASRMSCVFPRCEVEGFSVTFEQGPAGALWVREVTVPPARLSTTREPSARRAVAATERHAETDAVLRAQTTFANAEVVAQAPLSARGGTIALVLTDPSGQGDGAPMIAVTEEHAARLYDLPFPSSDARLAVRFADLDGDGRTDAVFQIQETSVNSRSYIPVTAPRPTMQSRVIAVDHGVEIAMLGAPDLAAAVQSALTVPTWSVTSRVACQLLRESNTLARWRRVAASDARVLAFSEPGLPVLHPTVSASATVTPEQIAGVGATCPTLVCSPDRPYCRGEWPDPGPGGQHYWFTRENNALRVLAFADYNGS